MSSIAKAPIHFLHIGKTGGTAVRNALSGHVDTGRYRLVLHGHNVGFTNIPPGEKVAFFLRRPQDRFISGFNSRKRKGRPRYNAEWSELERRIFSTFCSPNELAKTLSESDSPSHALAISAMRNIMHLLPYQVWLTSMEYIESRIDDVFFIGFQESLLADFQTLVTMLDLPEQPELPSDDLNAHRSPQHLDKSLDDDCVAILENWYAKDNRIYHRCKRLMAKRLDG